MQDLGDFRLILLSYKSLLTFLDIRKGPIQDHFCLQQRTDQSYNYGVIALVLPLVSEEESKEKRKFKISHKSDFSGSDSSRFLSGCTLFL